MKINFESSTACNSDCTFCPHSQMTHSGQMSDKLFHKIIKEGKEMGIKYYSPFMTGEPFMFPRIWEWLDYMEKEKVKVSLYTNGEYMDSDRLAKYTNIHYVSCSLNAATKETHRKVMQGPDFDTCKKNIDKLLNSGLSVRVTMIETKDNTHEVDKFKKMYPKNKVNGFGNWTGDKDDSLAREGNRVPCYVLFNQMFILANGLVVPCCMDYDAKQPLGDANIQHLKEIRDNAWWMRQKHKNLDFNIPVCEKCNYNCDG